MKIRFTLLALTLFIWTFGNSQIVEVRSASGGSSVNGQTIIVNGHSGESTIDRTLYVELAGMSDMDVNVRRYEMSVTSGTSNTFCWAVCPQSEMAGTNPTWDSPISIPMTVGTEYSTFKASHEPNGITGTEVYRFVWYDVQNPNTDTVWVDVQYNVGTLSIEEAKNSELNVTMFNGSLQVNALAQGNQNQVLFYDVLGNLVAEENMAKGENQVFVDTDDLSGGIYFVSLVEDGVRVLSRKVYVAK